MGESLPSRRANRNGDLHGFADFNCRFQVYSCLIFANASAKRSAPSMGLLSKTIM